MERGEGNREAESEGGRNLALASSFSRREAPVVEGTARILAEAAEHTTWRG